MRKEKKKGKGKAVLLGCWVLGCWMEMKNGTEKGQKEREMASCARVLGSWDAGWK